MKPTTQAVTGLTKVWTTLITNAAYIPGLITLDYSLKKSGSKYPLVALYTDTFPAEGHAALDARGIPKKHVPYLLPSVHKDYEEDSRFYDCWSKLTAFSLVDFERIVMLDSDMLVMKNMDELMDISLDDAAMGGSGDRVFACTHACLCNPMKKSHYPKNWIPSNCGFTAQHSDPEAAQIHGAPATSGLSLLNSGVLVINPSSATYNSILERLQVPSSTSTYQFPDQSLLADLFPARWVALPYIYNALKTLRWEGVHRQIWRDEEVKNVHYIANPKPWNETLEERTKVDDGRRDPLFQWWWDVNDERLRREKEVGINDGF
ncbi:hypothetical protein FQN54_004218 [Arachnomyces sp. PD_36]|nr:hypothetical protein FQN54_004218 [Arachnomyces sp. PD_36]